MSPPVWNHVFRARIHVDPSEFVSLTHVDDYATERMGTFQYTIVGVGSPRSSVCRSYGPKLSDSIFREIWGAFQQGTQMTQCNTVNPCLTMFNEDEMITRSIFKIATKK